MYKIRWKNYEPIHDTWETYDSLSCPDILEIYNLKHNVEEPKKKGKSTKKPKSKRNNSVSSSSGEDDDNVPYDEGSDGEYEVDRILDVRTKKDGTKYVLDEV